MGDSVPILLIGSIFFLLWGLSSLYTSEVHWGKVFTYWGSDMVMKGRIPARVHGIPVTAAGALGLVTSVLAMFAPNADFVETLVAVYIILILAGVIGSFVAAGLGFGDEEQDPVALEQAMRRKYGDRYGRW